MSPTRQAFTFTDSQQSEIVRIKEHATIVITKPLFDADSGVDNAGGNGRDSAVPESTEAVLCGACAETLTFIKGLFLEKGADGVITPHYIALDCTLSACRKSARLGCRFCAYIEAATLTYLLNGTPSEYESETERSGESWIFLTAMPHNMMPGECILNVGLAQVFANRIARPLQVRLCNDLARKSPCERSYHYTPSALHTDDDSVFKLANYWLRGCREQHDACNQVRGAEPDVPRRLLRLSNTHVDIVLNIRGSDYACLSHCWGSQQYVPTQLRNHGQRAFEIASLPKTFQDAILITKKLGVQYLWIDCFCIVQDDKKDWIEQSAVMAQIYANSVVTIAALASKNAEGGCFIDRNPSALSVLHTDGLVVEPFDKGAFWNLEVAGTEAESSPLHTRAWVVQERLSAPRTLFYGSLGVYWECRSMQASESHTKMMSEKTISDDGTNMKTMLGSLQIAAERCYDEEYLFTLKSDFQRQWEQLLQLYSICTLTYSTDKLVALSGITKDIEKYSGRKYIQGLWSDAMAEGLLWYHPFDESFFDGVRTSGRLQSDTFPSWTWASMCGKIRYLTSYGLRINWRVPIAHEDSTLRLRLRTWKREVVVNEHDELVLRPTQGGNGDLTAEYIWYRDEKDQADVPMWAILIQDILISETPSMNVAQCLVVSSVEDELYERLGLTYMRYGTAKENPFPKSSHGGSTGEDNIVLI